MLNNHPFDLFSTQHKFFYIFRLSKTLSQNTLFLVHLTQIWLNSRNYKSLKKKNPYLTKNFGIVKWCKTADF